MDDDGKNQQPLPAGVYGEPSVAAHGAGRWHLQWREVVGETYPNGEARYELFAVRDDGLREVQLTDQPDLQSRGHERWVAGVLGGADGRVSWLARRWDLPSGQLVEAGIYAAEVLYDPSGDVAGLASQPASPLVSGALIAECDGVLDLDLEGQDWAPDGSRIVVYREEESDCLNGVPQTRTHELSIVDLGNNNAEAFLTEGYGPRWSPDGAKIRLNRCCWHIWRINPDGTGLKKIVTDTPNWHPGGGHWSPTGSHITYYRYYQVSDAGTCPAGGRDVYRAKEDGSKKTRLTSDCATYPEHWR
jgi:hypothetical protein